MNNREEIDFTIEMINLFQYIRPTTTTGLYVVLIGYVIRDTPIRLYTVIQISLRSKVVTGFPSTREKKQETTQEYRIMMAHSGDIDRHYYFPPIFTVWCVTYLASENRLQKFLGRDMELMTAFQNFFTFSQLVSYNYVNYNFFLYYTKKSLFSYKVETRSVLFIYLILPL